MDCWKSSADSKNELKKREESNGSLVVSILVWQTGRPSSNSAMLSKACYYGRRCSALKLIEVSNLRNVGNVQKELIWRPEASHNLLVEFHRDIFLQSVNNWPWEDIKEWKHAIFRHFVQPENCWKPDFVQKIIFNSVETSQNWNIFGSLTAFCGPFVGSCSSLFPTQSHSIVPSIKHGTGVCLFFTCWA